MKLSDEDKDYKEVLSMLEPRHAPVTDMRFAAPVRPVARWKKTLARVSRLAAVLVVGIGIGLFFIRPDVTVAASKVIQLGVEKILTSKVCTIEMRVRMLPGSGDALPRISPKGDMTPVRLVYTSGDNGSSMKISWTDTNGPCTLELAEGERMKYNGRELDNEAVPAEAFGEVFSVIYSGTDGLKKLLNGETVKMSTGRNPIMVEYLVKKEQVRMAAEFSDSSGRLLSFKAYDNSVTPPLLMIETTSITYK